MSISLLAGIFAYSGIDDVISNFTDKTFVKIKPLTLENVPEDYLKDSNLKENLFEYNTFAGNYKINHFQTRASLRIRKTSQNLNNKKKVLEASLTLPAKSEFLSLGGKNEERILNLEFEGKNYDAYIDCKRLVGKKYYLMIFDRFD
jgi:hypothetical protein